MPIYNGKFIFDPDVDKNLANDPAFRPIGDPYQEAKTPVEKLVRGAQANAYALSHGIAQQATLPAKGLISGLNAVVPSTKNIVQPQDIQRFYREIDKPYQEGSAPGMGISNLAGNVMQGTGQQLGAIKLLGAATTAAAGPSLIPALSQAAGQLPSLLTKPISYAAQGGLQGLFSNDASLSDDALGNKQAAIFGTLFSGAAGILQAGISTVGSAVMNKARNSVDDVVNKFVPKKDTALKSSVSDIITKHIDPKTGAINGTALADDLESLAINTKPTNVIVNLNKPSMIDGLMSQMGPVSLGTGIGAVPGAIQGYQKDGVIGAIKGGIEGGIKGAAVGLAAKGVMVGGRALNSILSSKAVNNMISQVDTWAENAPVMDFFIKRLGQIGVSASLNEHGQISLMHEEDVPKIVKEIEYNGTKLKIPEGVRDRTIEIMRDVTATLPEKEEDPTKGLQTTPTIGVRG
jgi:hypothetical protein